MNTIRRGTKRFDQVLGTAKNIVCLSLSNNFVAQPLMPSEMSPREWIRRELDRFDWAMLRDRGDGSYCVKVHGNLWYEFEVEA